jgi:hypothetical protein
MAGNGYIYGYSGPPFNFLGNFCTTQWNAFQGYVGTAKANLPAIQQHYQIRAAQLRRTSGVLEEFYGAASPVLTPTFSKAVWRAGPNGWFNYVQRDDHLPMVAVSQIKDILRDQFQWQDEAVFQMNQLRNLIEKNEDKAQKATEGAGNISAMITAINGYFNKPEYQAALVKDQTDVYPAGSMQPRFRVHQLDVPTQWEQEQHARTVKTGGSVNIKEKAQ